MTLPDLNLLVALDVLLAERSVARAARRLRLSPSATSRTLARLREALGDPLLVRAGRGLVPTPRAIELAARTGDLIHDIAATFRPPDVLDLARLERHFTLRNRDGFVETFGPALVERVAREAPGVRLGFLPKADKSSTPLRDGSVDLETGVVGEDTGPDLRVTALFHDRFVGVARPGHPLLAGPITAETWAAERHVLVSRRGREAGPADDALARRGLSRRIAVVVGTYSEALALVRGSDLLTEVPERYTGRLRDGLATLTLPIALPDLPISLLWHPRLDADPAHRWLRALVRDVCTDA